mmetsp:Transcript_18672/g.33768  ORF Transcript_18672/g.33768 Transcript_18672/m.33768 type:complete len:98 (-) Transcript_18672:29-322(-)
MGWRRVDEGLIPRSLGQTSILRLSDTRPCLLMQNSFRASKGAPFLTAEAMDLSFDLRAVIFSKLHSPFQPYYSSLKNQPLKLPLLDLAEVFKCETES